MSIKTSAAVLAASWTWLFGSARATGLEDIDHVILFMQENRAFDHYFGTMAGVRGFNDANLQMNGNLSVWHQKVSSKYTNATEYMTPWYINYLGGDWPEASQCMFGGGNGWSENHAALNNGSNNLWPIKQNPSSIGFFKRDDLPTHFALAEGWLVGDMYQEGVIAATKPNRAVWVSGTINAPGGNLDPDLGGNPYIDNNETPGCEDGGINCYPLKWKTTAEYYEDAGTSWQVFQDADNFDDNPLAWFENFQDAKNGSSLYERGMQGETLQSFYDRAANGTLPEVSYVIAPAQLAEHQPYAPHDGAWLQTQVAKAVTESPKYNSTVLIVSYDETGGWFDHVNPFHSPPGTAGEWIDDPYGSGYVFTGPGLRVPFYIISPWTRKGGVYVEHSDHNSQVKFIEQWQAAKGRNVTSDEMVPWRRENMADLVNAFDFDNPDYSLPSFPDAPAPHKNADGEYDGSTHCEATYPSNQPPVPYTGNGTIDDMASVVEKGFKAVRGKLTEGRWLTFETDGNALSHGNDSSVDLDDASSDHDSEDQRWIVHVQELGGSEFILQTASKDYYICDDLKLCEDESDALVFDVSFTAGKGYQFTTENDGALVASDGSVSLKDDDGSFWSAFSVNY